MDTTINRSALSRAALATGLVLCAAAAITVATVRLAATETESVGEASNGKEGTEEVAVIRFSGQLEVRYETHGHMLDQWSIGEISMLSGERSGLSTSTPANEFSIDLQGTLNEGVIEVAGEVRVMQSGGFDPDLMNRFERPMRSLVVSFETTLRPGEEEQVADFGPDELGRVFLLKLTPSLVDQDRSAYWLFREVGRLVHSISLDNIAETAENALKHAEALHVAAEGMVSGERTERLVDLLGRLIESARAGEDEEAEELIEEIDRTGMALREDFEGWAEAEGERQSAASAAGETDATPEPVLIRGQLAESDADSDETAVEEAEVRENETVRVTVLGEVNRAGAYELEAGSTILDALGHAGGWTGAAALRRVILLRGSERFTLDVDDMISGGTAARLLKDGDTIVLRKSLI